MPLELWFIARVDGKKNQIYRRDLSSESKPSGGISRSMLSPYFRLVLISGPISLIANAVGMSLASTWKGSSR